MTELVKGKDVEAVAAISNETIVEELSLPPVKIHCSVLAEDAIKAAVRELYDDGFVAQPERMMLCNADGTEKHEPLLDGAGAMRETMNLFEAASALECGPEGMEHLSELPSQGMHVLLLDSEPTACEAAGGTALRLKVYADGVASGEPSALELPCDLADAALQPLLSELRGKVEAARPLVHARLLRERKLSRDSAKHSRQSADARFQDW